MSRFNICLLAALVVAAPMPVRAQAGTSTSSEQRERERERREEERERVRERAEAERERIRERAERDRERAEERAERDRERQERDAGGVLDTTVTFDARGSVTVSCPGGDVVVTGSDRNELKVRARTERGAIRFTSSGSRASLEPATNHGCEDGRFEVTVPTNARVTANSWSGSITVSGVRGDLEAQAQSGDVQVRDAGDRLDVQTLSGDITVAGVRGETRIHTLSGDVQLDGARGAVEVQTVSGDMELGDIVTNQVRTQSTSGDVTFRGAIASGGRYEFKSHSGEVTLHLPVDVGAQLTVSTFSGGIESDFPITLTAGEHGIGVGQAKRLNFTLGRGTARIEAESFSGDVTLSSTGRRP